MDIAVQAKIDDELQKMAAREGVFLRVTGNCMSPILNDQDRVLVRWQPDYRTGDILVVRLGNGHLVCHRLVGKYFRNRQRHFLTKPDNGRCPDAAVVSRMILGKIFNQDGELPIDAPSVFFRLQLSFSFVYHLSRRLLAKFCSQKELKKSSN